MSAEDDDLKLLALNSLLKTNEPRAMAEIQQILSGDSSEKLKKEAQFILGNHYSDATYPQIARISYVEGDVRILRGQQNEMISGAAWEKAVADLPLETGFDLATGAGRAEIELEDASTFYLGENSVLTFNDLHTTAGAPYTEIALLTGTASFHIRPYMAGQELIVKTPTNEFTVRYPDESYFRVTSYLDATAVASQSGEDLHLEGVKGDTVPGGQTVFYRDGRPLDSAAYGSQGAFADWDKWVASRVTERTAAIADVMKASGLTEPIPGLADMNGKGTFFDCAPYGTCWEPAADQPGESKKSSTKLSRKPATPAQTDSQAGSGMLSSEVDFPCSPAAIRYEYETDPSTGMKKTVSATVMPRNTTPLRGSHGLYLDYIGDPYYWAVCHDGSWIHQHNRYVWVVGHKRHHTEPVRWVRSGHRIAYVPIHPYDVIGKPPINRKEEVFAVNNKNGLAVERVKFDPSDPIEILKTPPREFRKAFLPPLSHADELRLEAYKVKDALSGNKGSLAKPVGVPLSFDHKSQSFMMTRQVFEGGKSVTVLAPLANRGGDLQTRTGSGGLAGGGVAHNPSSGAGWHVGGSSSPGSAGSSGSASHSSVASPSPAAPPPPHTPPPPSPPPTPATNPHH
jgi:hypothetical protein